MAVCQLRTRIEDGDMTDSSIVWPLPPMRYNPERGNTADGPGSVLIDDVEAIFASSWRRPAGAMRGAPFMIGPR